jgi:hypothetical protein
MAIQAQAMRPERRSKASGGSPSVREVCLLGAGPPVPGWAVGAEVRWEGRVYRVAAAQAPAGPAGGAERGYVHLAPASECP